jgi:hypothetical protein
MTSFRTRLELCVLVAVLFSLFAGIAFPQTVTGTISGTVTDSSGAAIAGAKVEVVNHDTGVARTIDTDAAGRYSALLLPLGNSGDGHARGIPDGNPKWN